MNPDRCCSFLRVAASFNYSIKTKVTLFTLAIFMVSLWSLSFYAIYILKHEMQNSLGEQQSSVVSFLADEIDSELKDRIVSLEAVANNINASLLAKPASLQQFMQERPILPILFNGGTFVTGFDGTAIASLPTALGRVGTNYMDRDFIAAALKEGKSTIGSPVRGKQSNSPIFVIAAPIRDAQGKVLGALAGVTELEKPGFLDKIANNRYGKTGDYLLNDAKSRLVITSTDKIRVMQSLPAPGVNWLTDRHVQGFDETGVTVNQLGVEVLESGKRIPVADWFLVASLPTDEVFAPVRRMQQHMLGATILLTLLAASLTSLMIRRQLSPISATINALSRLSTADLTRLPLSSNSQDEISRLVGGFNGLLEIVEQREALLQRSEAQLSSIFNTINDLIWLKDVDGVYVSCNPMFENFFGAKAADIIGKTDYDFVDKELADLFLEHDLIAMHKGGPSINEEWVTFADDGRRVLLETTKSPMYDLGGHLIGILGMSHDITERSRIEQSLRESEFRWRFAIEGGGDGLLDWNIQADETMLSGRWNEILGDDKNDVLWTSHKWLDRIHPEDKLSVEMALQTCLDGEAESYVVECRLNCKDGSCKWVLNRGMIVRRSEDGKPVRMIGTISDISRRKTLEEDARHRQEEQTKFVAMLAHELKTPLATIRMALGILSPYPDATLTKIERAVSDMHNIVDCCLRVGQLEAQKKTIYLSDCQLLDEFHELQRNCISPELLVIQTKISPALRTDQQMLRIILGNLIDNALKYSTPGSTVHLTVIQESLARSEGILITIKNLPGKAGWPDPDEVFQKYYRSKHAHHQTGSGLGLYLVAIMAGLLNGEVRYTPDNTHIRFSLWLPV